MANVKNYRKQGGEKWVVGGELDIASGGVLDFLSGAQLQVAGTNVTTGAVNLNWLSRTVDFTAAEGGSDVAEVEIQVQDAGGTNVAESVLAVVWLSDDDGGVGLTATVASGTVQAKTGEGTDLGTLTDKKALLVQTKADGSYTLEITDNADTGFYVAASLLGTAETHVSDQLTATEYGD